MLCLPNESGKSTVFDALHALFFKDHRSWDKEVAALRPMPAAIPGWPSRLEIGDRRFRVEKRWSKSRRGEAKVYCDGPADQAS